MSKGYLTTHVLDTYNGKPGSGIKGSLFKIDGENKVKISNFILNKDGRCDEPISVSYTHLTLPTILLV